MRTRFLEPRWIAAAILAIVPLSSPAATFSLDNLNLADFETLVREFSANSQYTSVNPAAGLHGLGSFELGVVGGITKAPDTLALVKRNDPGTTIKDLLPHAGALVRFGLPYGLTGEGLFLPKIKASGVKLGRWAIAAQWTLTDSVIENSPVHVAVKGYYTKTTLDYSQTINNSSTANIPVNSNIAFDTKLWGLQALVSYKIAVFEPWLGLGFVKAKGSLDVDAAGSGTILNQTVFGSQAKSTSSSLSSAQFLAGLDLSLGFFSLGAEYEKAFQKNSYTGRLSFRF